MNKKKSSKEIRNFIINFYVDKDFAFNHIFSGNAKIEDVKKEILFRLSYYSINYKLEYNDHDIGGFDSFTLDQIFYTKKEEYDVKIMLISTLKQYESQRTLMTYMEGTNLIIVYKILSMKWLKIIPKFSTRLSFYESQKFPYNARSCHLIQTNQLIITGGIDNENMACYFDSDTEAVIDLPKMPVPRQRHAMICLDKNRVCIIGGANCKKVTSLDVEFECYEDMPNLKYTRKDPCVAFVNETYLYTFMGYSDELGKIADNFEKLDIKEECGEWKLFPLNNFYGYSMPRTYCACAFALEDNCFYFFGGSFNSTAQGSVYKFEENDKLMLTKSKYFLPFTAAFDETSFVRPNPLNFDYYLFTYKEHQLINFNPKYNILKEIPQEWV